MFNILINNLMYKKIRFLILILIFPFLGNSQINISGTVTSDEETIQFANVILSKKDKTIVTGAVTEENGSFSLSVSKGEYSIAVSYLGYQTWSMDINLEEDIVLGEIKLKKEEAVLDGVTLIAEKPVIQRKHDRIIFNVEQSIAASGGNAVDALGLAPGVTVQNNSISMLGRGDMRVMVDDRILDLTGDDLMNFLNSIQADDIKSIEVIANPPAKYEAEGTGGLLNIILKKGLENNWSNSISTSTTYRRVATNNIGNNFKYRKNKVNLLTILNARFGDQRYFQEGAVFYSQNDWHYNTIQDRDLNNFSGRINFDYNLSENDVIGLQVSSNYGDTRIEDEAITNILSKSNQLDSTLVGIGNSKRKNKNILLNGHYVVKLDTLGRKISMDLDYFNFEANNDRNQVTNSFLPNNVFQGINYLGTNLTDRTIDNYNFKVDVNHPLKFFDFSYGAQAGVTKSVYNIDNSDNIIGEVRDEFEYTESIQALYLNGFKKVNEKLTVQLGLRFENTNTKGVSQSQNSTTKRSYFKIFPTAYLSYNPNENNSFSLNYGRRVNRPPYWRLNPAVFYINGSTRSQGNPVLQPSFSDNFEISHLYKGRLMTKLLLYVETDGIGTVLTANDDNFEQFSSHYNYYSQYGYGLFESYSFKIKPWLEGSSELYLMHYQSKITNDNIIAPKVDDFLFYFSTNCSFKLDDKNNKRLGLNYWYSAPVKLNETEEGLSHSLDLSFKMSLLNNSLQLSLNAIDLFNTSPRLSTSFVNGIVSNHKYWGINRGRGVRFSASYSFGNKKINVRNRRSGNYEEQRRAN